MSVFKDMRVPLTQHFLFVQSKSVCLYRDKSVNCGFAPSSDRNRHPHVFCTEMKNSCEKFPKSHRKTPAVDVNKVRQHRNNGVFSTSS